MLRRRSAIVLLTIALGCRTFSSLERPKDDAGAAADAGDASASAPPTLLALDEAVRACAQVYECDKLAAAIETTIAVPVAAGFAAAPSFAACVNWLAGRTSPARPGLEEQ